MPVKAIWLHLDLVAIVREGIKFLALGAGSVCHQKGPYQTLQANIWWTQLPIVLHCLFAFEKCGAQRLEAGKHNV